MKSRGQKLQLLAAAQLAKEKKKEEDGAPAVVPAVVPAAVAPVNSFRNALTSTPVVATLPPALTQGEIGRQDQRLQEMMDDAKRQKEADERYAKEQKRLYSRNGKDGKGAKSRRKTRRLKKRKHHKK